MKLLLHTCCAPCSIMCIEKLKEDNIDITSYWYNPNIHPYMEYKMRKDTLENYLRDISIPLIINDNYGLRSFIKEVYPDITDRCGKCYYMRLKDTARFAKENNYDAFSTTLLISPYQNHELLKKVGEELSEKYEIKFLYYDFRPYFREGQDKAKELELYRQKYCGCIFSEEERYLKSNK
ncbi:MAG TPA: epoxyqueuosine reductase QueH [Bacilli bacterium]|nr:epoxyqueuosine reductase QueH [Bacilli bacterium]